MKQQAFERDRSSSWDQFADQLEGVRGGYLLAAGTPVAEFVDNYREISRDLALAKSRGYSHTLIARLNELVIRGHNTVYVKRSGQLRATLDFIGAEFPRLVRASWGYVLVATMLFFGTGIGVIVMISAAPELVYSIMSAEDVAGIEAMYDPGAKRLGRERQSDTDFLMFGFYIWNNISISFQVFATGLLFGLGSIFYLAYNGVFIGAVFGHLIGIGYTSTFLPFVSGHGSFELTAIVLAGAAGLMLGHALIAPGGLRRVDSLKRAGRDAIQIVIGAVGMLVVAAFIEAFWSSSTVVPANVKYGVGGALWVSVLAYFFVAGRRRGT